MTRRKHAKITINGLKAQPVKTKQTYRTINDIQTKKDEKKDKIIHRDCYRKLKKNHENYDSYYDDYYDESFDDIENKNKKDILFLLKMTLLRDNCNNNNNLFEAFEKIKRKLEFNPYDSYKDVIMYNSRTNNKSEFCSLWYDWYYKNAYNYLMDAYKEAQYIEPFCELLLRKDDLFDDYEIRVFQQLVKSSKKLKKRIVDYLFKTTGFLLFKTNADCFNKILEFILPSFIDKNDKIELIDNERLLLPKINISAFIKHEYRNEYSGKQEYTVINRK